MNIIQMHSRDQFKLHEEIFIAIDKISQNIIVLLNIRTWMIKDMIYECMIAH
jgi:hypothetical protein